MNALGAPRSPRLYADLAWIWPFVSPPEEYVDEVAAFRARWQREGIPDGARILHLGSGGGSVDWHLKRYYQVTGVDRSPEMLAYSRSINPEVEYFQGDIRGVRLGRVFDGVLLHDAAAYLTSLSELQAAYATAAAHLAPGGVLLTPPEELRSRFRQHRVESQTRTEGDLTVTYVQVDFDPEPTDTWFEATFIFLIRRPGQPLQVEVDIHRCGLFHMEEYVATLRAAGFDPRASLEELRADLPPDDEYPLITAIKRPAD